MTDDWVAANQRRLAAEICAMEARLRRHAGLLTEDDPEFRAARQESEQAAAALGGPSALDAVARCFQLGPFERDVLLLTAADELDARIGALCSLATGGAHDRPTFALALAALDGAHWSALTPDAPLRAGPLVEVGEGRLTEAPLQIEERVLHHLLGVSAPDRRLRSYLRPVPAPTVPLPESLATVGRQLREIWRAQRSGPVPTVVLYGPEPRDIALVVVAAADGLPVYTLDAVDLPAHTADRDTFARLWKREALLDGALLVVDCHEGGVPERRAAAALTARLDVPVVIAAPDPLPLGRAGVALPVPRPPRAEQRALWRTVLQGSGTVDERLRRRVDEATAQFDLGHADITDAAGDGTTPSPETLWSICRTRARCRLGELAQHIEPRARWSQLRLPAAQSTLLRDIAAQVRGRAKVHHEWGFARESQRGLGVSAMFAGPSGTGKTLAAEVIAAELGLDLYRIDLSSVVSKYIGETEKNLRAVFDAADKGGAVLLFDEADALFGKRTEVRDSHDRYANVEISYLLQRMECYRGLAVLTTNMRSAVDQAFLRRLSFVVNFPFPDAVQRADIWRGVFPPEVPTNGLDPHTLARLSVTGGSIRNIALQAAFLAADTGEPVTMRHVLHAARSEYAKLDRPLTEVEAGGWA
ncbi:ATP-binding protein [Streptomyces sp. NPDC001657]|uniref:ATP-binding protein n=1 Tax=Streptomyces sp. NPDC001657 TaxID=3154522 RepID=UPI00332E94DC